MGTWCSGHTGTKVEPGMHQQQQGERVNKDGGRFLLKELVSVPCNSFMRKGPV